MLFLNTQSGLLLPKTKLMVSAALEQPADTDAEKGYSRGSVASDAQSLRRQSVSTEARPVERGERPIALAALPGVNDEMRTGKHLGHYHIQGLFMDISTILTVI